MASSHHDSLNRLPTFLALDRRLEIFLEKLHPDLRYLGLSSLTPLRTDPYRLFSLLCTYHLCACILHSSIVPVFSGVASDPQISKRFSRMSAKEAIKHSTIVLDMATTFLNICTDVTLLSGITGYALFVSSSIQFKSLSAQGKLQNHGIGRCNAAILMLQHLKEYSRPLQVIVLYHPMPLADPANTSSGQSSVPSSPQQTSTLIASLPKMAAKTEPWIQIQTSGKLSPKNLFLVIVPAI